MNRIRICGPLAVAIGAGLMLAPDAATADEPVRLPDIEVQGERPKRLEAAEEEVKVTPGGANLITAEEMRSRSTETLEDAFAYQPGVVIQEFFGGIDQPRLNIRGSGIQSNPLSRGLVLMEDGLPINLPDGSFVIGQIDPRTASHVLIQRGANALQSGGATLGGSVDLRQFTGRDADRLHARLEAGGDGYRSGQISTGTVIAEDWDIYASFGHGEASGFRQHNTSDRSRALLNTGVRLGEDTEIRLSYTYTDLAFDIPGPISKAQMRRDPTQVGNSPPFFIRTTTPGRETEIHRVAAFGETGLGGGTLSFGLFTQDTDDTFENQFRYAFTDSRTYGGKLSYAHDHTLMGLPNSLTVGLWGNWGDMDRRFHLNNYWPGFGAIPAFSQPGYGEVGAQYGAVDMEAANIALFLEDRLGLSPSLDLILGGQLTRATRDAAKTDGTASLDQSYTGASPKLGLLYHFTPAADLFANLSRSFEAPTFDELVSDQPMPAGRGVRLNELDEQTATTLEVGGRGRNFGIGWDVAAYHSWVRDELLTTTDANGSSATRNYDKTRHWGLEAGLGGQLWRDAGGNALDWRGMYTFSHFTFDGGAYNGNRIAGVPRHVIQAEVTYRMASGFYFAPNVFWSPEDTPTDHSNTLYQDNYALFGFNAGYRSPEGWTFFVQGKNVFDKNYAGSYLITDRPSFPYSSLDQQPVFTPGSGASLIAGISYSW